jgi:magnesium and cobalt exporter, CNNM family
MLLAQTTSIASQAPLLIVMGTLLLGSAIASASETALLGLSRSKRAALRAEHSGLGLIVDRLLINPRQLLLQVLLLNMVINVGYFITTSIVTLNAESTTARIVISIASLFAIILVGEVFAKLFAVASPTLCLRIVAPLHLILKQPLRPLITILERYFILPGTRLLVPGPPPPPGITAQEMSALLEMGTTEGVIDQSEQDLLSAIIMLSQRRVEEIMRPRVDFDWIDANSRRQEIIDVCSQSNATRFPVFEGGLDGKPIGMTDAKRVLAGTPIRDALAPLLFIPEQATLDTLLTQLRGNAQTIALAVDEHGTVVGLVALADIADQLLSGIADSPSTEAQEIQMIGPATWSVPGRLAVHEWSSLFSGLGPTNRLAPSSSRTSAKTVAGLMMHSLARVPKVGDQISLGSATLTVLSMNDLVVETVEVKLNLDDESPSNTEDEH